MNQPSKQKIENLFGLFPDLYSVANMLNRHHIQWMIGGSGCLYLFGNDRQPEDVDILIPDEQHDLVDKLFEIKSFTYTSPQETVRNSNPGGNHVLQFTSHLKLSIGGKEYSFDYGLIPIQRQIIETIFLNEKVRIAPPEEALLVKALLQRGEAEGKHDLEDIQTFLKEYNSLDRDYLTRQASRLGAKERIAGILLP